MATELWRTDTQVVQNAEGKPEAVHCYGVAGEVEYFVSIPITLMQALLTAASISRSVTFRRP